VSFVSRLFALFVIANIFSVSAGSSVVFAGGTDTEVHTEVSDDKKSDENIDKNSKSELKNAGFVSVHSEDCAFSYELDDSGNVKNVKDLLADDEPENKNSVGDSQTADGICVYSSYSRFEVFSGNGTVEFKKSNRNQDLSKKNSDEPKSEINNEKLEIKSEAEKKSESLYEVQNNSKQVQENEAIEEYSDDEIENEGGDAE